MTNGFMRFGVYTGLGIVIGALVALLDWITVEVALEAVLEAPIGLQMVLPALGVLVVSLILKIRPGLNSTTSDAYLESYHSGTGAETSTLFPKLLASFATIGSGGAVGMEGPAVLTGATLGQALGDRIPRVMGERPRLVLLVAGAAAGIAAVFKAPATGVLFAIESPYKRDISRHGLIPALLASAASYLTFVFFLGAEPLLRFAPFQVTLRDEIVAAVLLGVLAGGVSRGLAAVFRWSKYLYRDYSFRLRFGAAAVIFASGLLLAQTLVDKPLTLGLGADLAAEIVLDAGVSFWVIVALFLLRALVTSATLGVGGVGGVFIPLVVQGMLLGRAVEILVGAESTGLYPVIGLAAVLGSAYRTPLAAVVFVAETTGRAEYVIPALIATAIAQALMGEGSVSEGQRGLRQGQLERRLNEPSSVVMIPEVGTINPDSTLLEVIDAYGDRPVSLAVPVGGPDYVGLIVLHDLAAKMLEHGPEATAREAMRDLPAVGFMDPAIDAARLMNEFDTAAIAVVDDQNRPVGVISATSLAGLDSVPTITPEH
ncbi:MAG: chloride channel protein [Acidimicrobiales bacterium]